MQDAAEALLEKTILRHDVVTASYVESCGTTGDAAAADFIRQLQPACVKRGQVLSIDSGSFDRYLIIPDSYLHEPENIFFGSSKKN
jgi:hypothetical protein